MTRRLFHFLGGMVLAAALLPAVGWGASPKSVLVGGFEPLPPDAPGWIGQAVRKDLSAELSRRADVRVISVRRTFASDEQALSAAQAKGVDYVLIGEYQMVGVQLRLSGRVMDVAQGKALGAIKADGSLQDLFALEDDLAGQLEKVLMPQASSRPAPSPALSFPTTGPVERGAFGPYGIYGMYQGSSLQRAIRSGNLGVGAAPSPEGQSSTSYWYRFGVPVYPWYGGGPFWYYFPTRRYYYPPYNIYRPPAPYHRRINPPPANVQGYVPMTQGYFPMTLQP